MIRCSFSLTLSSVKHILQDINLKAPNCQREQLFTEAVAGKIWILSDTGEPKDSLGHDHVFARGLLMHSGSASVFHHFD